MDKKALYNITYGVFLLGTTHNGTLNACITNTCMQVASSPTRIAIAVINANYTADLLKESGVFALTLLDNTVHYETIKFFGMQSGRSVNKFPVAPATDANGCPYLPFSSCAVISARVVDSMDLGSHTLFIAEVEDAQRLSSNPPLTYADYQARVKPKPAAAAPTRKVKAWRCKICGYVYEGETLPEDYLCPLCGHDASDFEPVYE
ncbi:MAG: flavin reductase [Coriobacteriia bacterium]|nr:flavin reductase [Coriobacteriia bacterium]